MFIYNGKFNWGDQAVNETITVVFPASFAVNDPVSVFFQWSKDPVTGDHSGVAVSNSSVVSTSSQPTKGSSRIHVSFGEYGFDAIIAAGFTSLSLTMCRADGTRNKTSDTLKAVHINTTKIPSVVVYTGRLKWNPYAHNEMVTLVVPYGVVEGGFFGIFHQWTSTPDPNSATDDKENDQFLAAFAQVTIGAEGTITAQGVVPKSTFTCNLTFSDNMKKGSFTLSPSQSLKSTEVDFESSYAL